MKREDTREANFDGLIGPTHNYAGLSHGNIASKQNIGVCAYPKKAALQGLSKMKFLRDLGMDQGVIPPQSRPAISALRRLGFCGDDHEVIQKARAHPMLLAKCSSASSMWAANAATVSPSADSGDGRVHFTPANLASKFHRSIEPETTGRILQKIFPDPKYFAHHAPLPSHIDLGDEGAANHTRLASSHASKGIQVFVYGVDTSDSRAPSPQHFPARQTLEASHAIARLHRLDPARVVFAQQAPDTIDAGVFHNDVIAVGNENALLYHERAFLDSRRTLARIRRGVELESDSQAGREFFPLLVQSSELKIEDALKSYLFNSQLITLPRGEGMALIAPIECRENEGSHRVLERLLSESSPLKQVHYLDVRQSMRNGGGPACLRLRVLLNRAERAAVHPGCWLNDRLYEKLTAWVHRHYRESLSPEDLGDPMLLDESRSALDALTQILGIGSIYEFQSAGA